MTNNEIFLSIKDLGDLYIYDVLLSFIYPRVFVCTDKYDCKYLFYEMSSKDNRDIWLVSKITKDEFYDLIDNKICIQEAYKHKSSFEIFSVSRLYGDEDIVTLSYDSESWIGRLPAEKVYADSEQIVDGVNEDTLDGARESGCTTFDIKLFADSSILGEKTMEHVTDLDVLDISKLPTPEMLDKIYPVEQLGERLNTVLKHFFKTHIDFLQGLKSGKSFYRLQKKYQSKNRYYSSF